MHGTVILVVPNHAWPEGGNAVTARRIAAGVRLLGLPAEAVPVDQLERRVARGDVRLLHALHAHRSGVPASRLAAARNLPLVVTFSGTDLSQDLAGPILREEIAAVMEKAVAVTVFHRAAAAALTRALPAQGDRAIVIPPSVTTPEGSADRPGFGIPPGTTAFLLAAGLRPVKRPLYAFGPLDRLRAEGFPVTFVVAGPELDPLVGQALRDALGDRSWAMWLGSVPHPEMGALLRSVDIVLNTSESEGLSNAVLEAMAVGKPVLAADNEGNRAALGETGLLFADADELHEGARRLLADPLLRRRLGEAAQQRARLTFRPEDEARAYADLYRKALAHPDRRCCQTCP